MTGTTVAVLPPDIKRCSHCGKVYIHRSWMDIELLPVYSQYSIRVNLALIEQAVCPCCKVYEHCFV